MMKGVSAVFDNPAGPAMAARPVDVFKGGRGSQMIFYAVLTTLLRTALSAAEQLLYQAVMQ